MCFIICIYVGDVKAFLDNSAPGHGQTIRTISCQQLTHVDNEAHRCGSCSSYRKVLSAMLCRVDNQQHDPDRCNPSSTTNYRYLKSPEKIERMKRLHAKLRISQQRARRLEKRYSLQGFHLELLLIDRGVAFRVNIFGVGWGVGEVELSWRGGEASTIK